jgi:hypothetical protein
MGLAIAESFMPGRCNIDHGPSSINLPENGIKSVRLIQQKKCISLQKKIRQIRYWGYGSRIADYTPVKENKEKNGQLLMN